MDPQFIIKSQYQPSGDQPRAIEDLVQTLRDKQKKHHVLLGATGTGKTFTVAHTLATLNRPALVIAHNKTLAAQLFAELRELFPHNSVNFFISYYDYYIPESYVPSRDLYIEKESSINEDIDKMRHATTQALLTRKDVIVVSSVSCIYGLGSPALYKEQALELHVGQNIGSRQDLLRSLVSIQYSRNDTVLERSSFRVRGDTIDILPSNRKDEAIRIELFGDEIESIKEIDALTGHVKKSCQEVFLFPTSHYVTKKQDIGPIVKEILTDLGLRLRDLHAQNKLVEYQRLEQRTMADVEALEQIGYCPGIENYSRYLSGSLPGEPPPTLLDYFPPDFLTIIDESHITNAQISAMHKGDRSRKSNLVDYGFRLPAALDNRPLTREEFLSRCPQILHVSATPSPYEIDLAQGAMTELIIRPTGLIDPEIIVRPATGQVDDVYGEITKTIQENGRILVTTLTRQMAMDLSSYLKGLGVKTEYIHHEVDSIERVEILKRLRQGKIDVIVGVNLLREGLDLPEVKLVAVLDADREGFLRSKSSLIQIVGRAARNKEGKVVFYADKITPSMAQCMEETNRRRSIQVAYNEKHGIEPQSIIKPIYESLKEIYGLLPSDETTEKAPSLKLNSDQIEKEIQSKTKEMKAFAAQLNFEEAARIRDEIASLKEILLSRSPLGETSDEP